jgi:hypothetical protein
MTRLIAAFLPGIRIHVVLVAGSSFCRASWSRRHGIVIPVVLIYAGVVYWCFRGKVGKVPRGY